jgi:hypothetical protein
MFRELNLLKFKMKQREFWYGPYLEDMLFSNASFSKLRHIYSLGSMTFTGSEKNAKNIYLAIKVSGKP